MKLPGPCSVAGGLAATPAKAPRLWPRRKPSAATSPRPPRPPPTTGPSGAGQGWSPHHRARWPVTKHRRRGSPILDLCRVVPCRWGGPVGVVEQMDISLDVLMTVLCFNTEDIWSSSSNNPSLTSDILHRVYRCSKPKLRPVDHTRQFMISWI